MADAEPLLTKVAPAPSEPVSVKIIPDVPVIFADAITNHVMSAGVIKALFHRLDANPKDPNEFVPVQVLQLIMPTWGFVDLFAFFEHRLQLMIARGHVQEDLLEERRKAYKDLKA